MGSRNSATEFDPEGVLVPDSLFGLQCTEDDAKIVILPVAFDATASFRTGTAGGPRAIRDVSGQIELWDPDFGAPWRAGITFSKTGTRFEARNQQAHEVIASARSTQGGPDALKKANTLCEAVHNDIYNWTCGALARGTTPGIVGGDHSVAFGGIRAASEAHHDLGVLQIDAHADLRESYEGLTWSHASIMHNVITRLSISKLVQVGVRDQSESEFRAASAHPRIEQWLDNELGERDAQGHPWSQTVDTIVDSLPDTLWISFDIDGLDPSLCPGTGTPVPGGLTWRAMRSLLLRLKQSERRVVGFDLCEVGAEQWDAIVGSRVLYTLCGLCPTSD